MSPYQLAGLLTALVLGVLLFAGSHTALTVAWVGFGGLFAMCFALAALRVADIPGAGGMLAIYALTTSPLLIVALVAFLMSRA